MATAMGMFAAIPASIFYNHFGNRIREIGAQMDDFLLEFLNLAERNLEDEACRNTPKLWLFPQAGQ